MPIASHYLWWIVALILFGVEVALPGYFMLWIGIGAALTGALAFALPGLSWPLQALAFVALAFLSCLAYARWMRPRTLREPPSARYLNRRAEQLIGQRYVLVEAIVNGRGRAQVGDGQWSVSGPDLPVGAVVEVAGVEGATLNVRPG